MNARGTGATNIGPIAAGRARGPQAFNPVVVLALLLVGAFAFFATLYFIGSGETGEPQGDASSGHGLSVGLNGYAGLRHLIEREGRETIIVRDDAELDNHGILILTPPFGAESEIDEVLAKRGFNGPTIVILPKWDAISLPPGVPGAKRGWVQMIPGIGRAGELEYEAPADGHFPSIRVSVSDLRSSQGRWSGGGLAGQLPRPEYSLSASADDLMPLVSDADGGTLIGFVDDGDNFYAGKAPFAFAGQPLEGDDDYESHTLIVVAEADLMNNYGLAEKDRARLAMNIINLAGDADGLGRDAPVYFDVTLNGLGQSPNLLTLAFQPPFLAATLCLIFAMIVIGWRAFGRFGPPIAEAPAMAFGKERLVGNSAALILRAKRFLLLRAPYIALERSRLSNMLGLRRVDDKTLDDLLARRGAGDERFSHARSAMEQATSPNEILRAAQELKSLEKVLSE